MNLIDNIIPNQFALLILGTGSLFAIFWFMDSLVHGKLVHVEISEKELQQHRLILLTSVLMEISLVLMYWFNIFALPFFIAFFITRTVHEFIDELHWHAERCTPYESFIHLGMWISILINTAAMFIWGFFTQYKGLSELNVVYFIWAIIIAICILFIGIKEWKR